MKGLWEITWYGRGGQGAVTASNALARAAFMDNYYDVQAFPFFGAERRGAPVKAFTRISTNKIYDTSQIYLSDIIVVFDYSLLKNINLDKELKKGGFLIINSSIDKINIKHGHFRLFAVNATKISLDLGLVLAGFPIINTSMLGAFTKSTQLITYESMISVISDMWPEKFLNNNLNASKLAYDGCIEVN